MKSYRVKIDRITHTQGEVMMEANSACQASTSALNRAKNGLIIFKSGPDSVNHTVTDVIEQLWIKPDPRGEEYGRYVAKKVATGMEQMDVWHEIDGLRTFSMRFLTNDDFEVWQHSLWP